MTTPARVMTLSHRTGSLTIDKDADIILVDSDPLKNISDIRKISFIMKGGEVFDSTELHTLIGFGLSTAAR